MEGGLESLIGRNSVRFSPALTGGIRRPFPRRIHRRHRLRCPAEGPHWKASSRTNMQAYSVIHVHFRGPYHRLACIFRAWCPPGTPPSPVCRPLPGPTRGDKTYTIDVQSSAKTVSIDCLKLAYVLHVHTESASLPPLLPSITTHSGRLVSFPDYQGCSGLRGSCVVITTV
jgi:hypothetical protein